MPFCPANGKDGLTHPGFPPAGNQLGQLFRRYIAPT